MEPRKLITKPGIAAFSIKYDPTGMEQLFNEVAKKKQRVSVIEYSVCYLMSPRTRAYVVSNKLEFDGYVTKLLPSNMTEEKPTITVTITPVEEDPQPRLLEPTFSTCETQEDIEEVRKACAHLKPLEEK